MDAVDWKTAIAKRTEEDGTSKIVFVDPPFAGGTLTIGGRPDRPTLTFDDDPEYVFERISEK